MMSVLGLLEVKMQEQLFLKKWSRFIEKYQKNYNKIS